MDPQKHTDEKEKKRKDLIVGEGPFIVIGIE